MTCVTCAMCDINITDLGHDILYSRLFTHPPSTLSDHVDYYNSPLSNSTKHPYIIYN